MPKGNYRSALRGKPRQASNVLCAGEVQRHASVRKDTRAGNFLFEASKEDIHAWRVEKGRARQRKAGGIDEHTS